MKRTLVLAVLMMFGLAAISHAQVRCEANINGFKIHTVYIMGDQYNGVAWAYKHIAEETCLTPTTDINKADAILEVHRIWTPGSRAETAPLTVSCSSNKCSTVCSDSTGNQLTVDCSGGACTSYYGPSLTTAVAGAFNAWMSTRWYQSDARLYTPDHKILWKSESQKRRLVGGTVARQSTTRYQLSRLQNRGMESLQVQEFPALGFPDVRRRVRSLDDH